jgi:hypothetical protein
MHTRLFAILAAMLVSSSAWAVCPQQEATAVFFNGMWTPEKEAREHKDALAKEVYASGVSKDCVHFELSHTQNDGPVEDVVEAIVQQSTETTVAFSQLVRMFLRLITPDAIFGDVIDAAYNRNVGEVNDTQLDKHFAKVKEVALDKGHRAIVITHSQGGNYANALWHRLTSAQQADTRLVTVATPASNVADGGPNTRLTRDGVANRYFLAATIAGTIPNTGLCDKEVVEEENSWLCHGFETGYLHDVGARDKIVADIIRVLPSQSAILKGFTFRRMFNWTTFEWTTVTEGGATVRLVSYDEESGAETTLAETISDTENGLYIMQVPACEQCYLSAFKFILEEGEFYDGYVGDLQIVLGETYTVDMVMFPPPVSN